MNKGVLLVNLGSPDSPSVADVRRYLREFLMDGRVLDAPWPVRFCVVHFAILPFRPKQSAEAYHKIWTPAGSPLVVTSRNVQATLQQRVSVPVELAMRYQNPSISHAVRNLAQKGVDEVLLIPLFPHYAMSSFETAVERVKEVAAAMAPRMQVRVQPPCYEEPDYITALVGSAQEFLNGATITFCSVSTACRSATCARPIHGAPLPGIGELLRDRQPGACHVLSGAVFQDGGGLRQASRRAGRQILNRFSVPPGARSLAQAVHGLRASPPRAERREEAAGDVPGLCFRLPRDAGGNRIARTGDFCGSGRDRVNADSLSKRAPALAGGAGEDGGAVYGIRKGP